MTETHAPGRHRRTRRAAVALLFTLLSIGSPWVTTSMASNPGGVPKLRPPTFGDCKNHNSGLHYGYVCESEEIPV
jgi:hypothetical protein